MYDHYHRERSKARSKGTSKIHAQEVVLMTAIFSHTQQQKPGLEPPSSQEPGNEASFRLVRPW